MINLAENLRESSAYPDKSCQMKIRHGMDGGYTETKEGYYALLKSFVESVTLSNNKRSAPSVVQSNLSRSYYV